MTFEQLSIFVAVAEREHLTKAAAAIGLTPSAVSASIKALEAFYGVQLFHRVGRGIELTKAGRIFVAEAQATLARARSAALVLSELGALERGTLDVYASQTIASYWLPQRLMRFHRAFPGIDIRLTVGNTKTVSQAVHDGLAEVGFVEGTINDPALSSRPVAQDAMVVVVSPSHPFANRKGVKGEELLTETQWIMREAGSGTRSEFEAALTAGGCDLSCLKIAMTLPSNEAVLSALLEGSCAAALSSIVSASFVRQGDLTIVDFSLPPRAFTALRHKERHQSQAAAKLMEMCLAV
ncbi:LysR family transcriptional regulator [Phyllobacterium myrsinacearum]|uniref:LysR family transcriptional regulator n=1 Tax=Phyllobacterium myrsinacearum TaxID=28101 RepID=A0A2S9JQZ1_9HYPH|nr:LysR family transcriptional regulator [Phyllobacterium myrsinacearum]PRD55601.1 LysR family transcriptional regulator [Phyllobacterium myrsinacearum]PWV90482.1 LysR family transcriptional regulator [Phyllobacterium myrsinacearum]RZV05325.1 DNA-binding transcriptional LysR family regulator [Phyllobacterium myrsinacearum]